jgi:hypothetical protein
LKKYWQTQDNYCDQEYKKCRLMIHKLNLWSFSWGWPLSYHIPHLFRIINCRLWLYQNYMIRVNQHTEN